MSQLGQPASPYVLVVEDDPLLMMVLCEYVEDSGCEPVEANTVAEAIELLETRSDIRIVLSDLDMRGSTAGMKLAVMIRDRWPPIELIMVSSRPWDPREIPARGVVFGKPFDRRKIEKTVRALAA